MRPLYARLQEARRQLCTGWEVLERDYLLSWVLAGIGQIPESHQTLVFKGGTALKKCYFGDYRFSEDLDFSGLDRVSRGETMEQLVQDACGAAASLLEEYAQVEIACERYSEGEPHPGGQEAFVIRARFPWHSQLHTRVMVEITMDATMLWPTENRAIIYGYDEPLDADIKVYSLEEVVAEKLRAILQHTATFNRRGWSRSRARDYYDLWRVLGLYEDHMDLTGFNSSLHRKCAVRDVDFADLEDFFYDPMLSYVARTWEQSLGLLVPGLPSFEKVIPELRRQLVGLICSS